jgi:hypothetical protein
MPIVGSREVRAKIMTRVRLALVNEPDTMGIVN